MTCRVARLSQDIFRVDLVFCCECGSGDLEVCYTSKALGPHLCPDLRPVQGRVRNVDGNPDAIVDEGAACCLNRRRCTQVSLTYERQRKQKEDLCSVNAAGDCSSMKPSVT